MVDERYHAARHNVPLLNEADEHQECCHIVEELGFDWGDYPEGMRRMAPPPIPSLSEPSLVRHYTQLSRMNFGVDVGFYPLGSCTMKYNPKVSEALAAHPGMTRVHPRQPEASTQGILRIMYELQGMLAEIGGVHEVSLQPAAGAHGEFLGMRLVRAHFDHIGERRKQVLLPDTSHGTNPASAVMSGYEVLEVPSKDGTVDLDALEKTVSEDTAAFMLTNPNTLGLFEQDVLDIARILHDKGALLYYDGANLNAIMGRVRPGDMNYDIVHFNLHKTFATPHGGGGPGSGPVGVSEELSRFLPVPIVAREEDVYYMDYDRPDSIGKIHSHYGNTAIMLRAYAYIKLMGADGLRQAAELAVLNSNYLAHRLSPHYPMPYGKLRKHEFVLSGSALKDKGLRTLDVAKRLIDYGFHPPTVYFPLIVEEALMVEPTETEARRDLDAFADALIAIAGEADTDPEALHSAPQSAPVGRVDEVYGARNPVYKWQDLEAE
ncbi:MAG: aminomethyl-transferring glycine dehydrogenase subunit GcvPB [Thermoplasmata archaeon]|nr:MAG: aminomethyl-transferring glycine dehydrogenase subunit GcvPB [Thermoplasmata archaeon]